MLRTLRGSLGTLLRAAEMSIKIKRFLQATYPEQASLFAQLKTIPKLAAPDLALPEAVVRVVIGQMLSGAAADTIYGRVSSLAAKRKLKGSWRLNYDDLRSCGLSGSKAKTICAFGEKIGNRPSALEYWRELPVDALMQEIKSNKGMGDWTAGIVALFYIGHEDVFPLGDATLKRAVAAVEHNATKISRKAVFDPNRAAPFRSYLALYLWQAIDTGQLA